MARDGRDRWESFDCPDHGLVEEASACPWCEARDLRVALERIARGRDRGANVLREIADAALHPAESLYACPTCGENVTRYGRRCPTCERNLEEDRLEKESGR